MGGTKGKDIVPLKTNCAQLPRPNNLTSIATRQVLRRRNGAQTTFLPFELTIKAAYASLT
jgi:hypothetical protein